ncbi:metal-dependent transcriptional regulator [Salinispira pacifica]|uniref:Transcriptional regulator MntR n=1 Tax=Salinispira pacifica TaxID=1307761 RepID=V5WEI9_9SPIO|nr:metal-dependent transcriptional regulator [Salinispira pacifica]AHC14030.1 Iron-dependent transcription repressor [Salinispira pacifica]
MTEYSESLEMYLETILDLSVDGDEVYSVDVAKKLKVSKPSVNRALGILKNDGMINHEHYGSISLTKQGLALAEDVRLRHDSIKAFLICSLNLDPALAEKDACRMEHILSPGTLEAIKDFVKSHTKEPT